MIEKEFIENLVLKNIEGSDLFLVEVVVKTGNNIQVMVDSMEGASIDACIKISRFLNNSIDREEEDFSLEVSSPGLGSPFRVKQQYAKNIGRDIEVVLNDGLKKRGKLLSIADDLIVLETLQKDSSKGKHKKAKSVPIKIEIDLKEIKTTKAVIFFKWLSK